MAERKVVGASKITTSWRVQLAADARRFMDKRDKKAFKVGDRVVFYVNAANEVVIDRA